MQIRAGKTMMADVGSKPKRSREPAAGAADQAQVDSLMRRFFEQSQSGPIDLRGAAQPQSFTPAMHAPRDFDMSTELLDRAARAFDLLTSRCAVLEEALNREIEGAKSHATARNETIEQWKRLASDLQAQLEASERSATALKQRYETSEARAATAERNVASLERATADAASHAALAEQLSTRLHDKVVAVFGNGSRAHPVLETIATVVKTE
jgi:hypothetical protein